MGEREALEPVKGTTGSREVEEQFEGWEVGLLI